MFYPRNKNRLLGGKKRISGKKITIYCKGLSRKNFSQRNAHGAVTSCRTPPSGAPPKDPPLPRRAAWSASSHRRSVHVCAAPRHSSLSTEPGSAGRWVFTPSGSSSRSGKASSHPCLRISLGALLFLLQFPFLFCFFSYTFLLSQFQRLSQFPRNHL